MYTYVPQYSTCVCSSLPLSLPLLSRSSPSLSPSYSPPPSSPPSLFCVVVSLCVCEKTTMSPLMDGDTVFMDKCQVGCTHTHTYTTWRLHQTSPSHFAHQIHSTDEGSAELDRSPPGGSRKMLTQWRLLRVSSGGGA